MPLRITTLGTLLIKICHTSCPSFSQFLLSIAYAHTLHKLLHCCDINWSATLQGLHPDRRTSRMLFRVSREARQWEQHDLFACKTWSCFKCSAGWRQCLLSYNILRVSLSSCSSSRVRLRSNCCRPFLVLLLRFLVVAHGQQLHDQVPSLSDHTSVGANAPAAGSGQHSVAAGRTFLGSSLDHFFAGDNAPHK